jgi:myosin heavy subunit
MANVSIPVIVALRETISNLEKGSSYQWGHMGSCNCGNLAQVITNKDKAEIHKSAMRRHGDWNEQLIEYCPTSGLPIDHIIDEMLAFGFTTQDLAHLEKLSDPKILQNLPLEKRYLKHNIKSDVILYFKTWANYLEKQLIEKISIKDAEAIHELV